MHSEGFRGMPKNIKSKCILRFMGRFKGLICGWEGVLVDTRQAYFRSVNNVLKKHGRKEISRETFDFLFVKGSVRMFIHLGYPSDAEQLTKERRAEYDNLIASFAADQLECDCVHELGASTLRQLKAEGYLIAIATNSHLGPLNLLLDKFCMRPLVDVIVTLDDADVAKPNPHMVQLAYEKLGLAPAECAMVGDRITDMQAGRAAGTYCIGIARNRQDESELLGAGADEVIKSVSELLGIL